MHIRLLENYPFEKTGVTIAEGFAAYDGNLRGVPGRAHGGIDYVLKKNGEFASFSVYTMYEGDVVFGVSESWGKYFIVSKQCEGFRYDTVYAHLDHIDQDLQKYAIIRGDKDFVVPARYRLGWSASGGTGSGSGIRHLHIELHEKNLRTGQHARLDPYGVYARLSSGLYVQPGGVLPGAHFWTENIPRFAAMNVKTTKREADSIK